MPEHERAVPDTDPVPPTGAERAGELAAELARAARPEVARPGLLRALLAVLVVAIALADRMLPAGVAAGVLYVLPVWIGLWLRERRTARVLAVLGAVLIAVDAGLSLGSLAPEVLLANAAIALFALAVAARLGRYRLDVERALRDSREAWAAILRSLGEGVVCTDRDERVVFLNEAAERMTGVPAAEAEGEPVGRVLRMVPPPRRRRSDLRPDPEAPAPTPILELRSRGGGRLPVATSSAPLMGGGGRVVVLRDATDQRRYERAVERLAFRDAVTGLLNRNALADRLTHEVERARRNKTVLAVLFLDLDGFKTINDTRGHHAGDLVLEGVARRLNSALRAADTVARVAGDEFCVLVPDLARGHDVVPVVEKLIAAVERTMVVEGAEVAVGASVGIALCPAHAREPAELLRCADQAMYAAKQAGGHRWAFHRPAPSDEPAGSRMAEGR